MKREHFIPLLIIAAGLLAYHNCVPGVFVFDDRFYIGENQRIRHFWPPWEILTHSDRPVVILSLAANYALGGLNPWGYHALNAVIHILAALVLYGVVRRTLTSEVLRSKWGAAATWLAGAVALIWVVHPLQTESVTYTIQRGESLMGFFYLLTLYCVIRGSGSTRAVPWQVGAAFCCVLGMASKQVMVTAPVVILLYDRVFLARSWREVQQRRWPVYAGMTATWLLLPVLNAKGPIEVPGWQPTAGFAYKGITPFEYLLTQAGVIVHYLQLSFWPRPLIIDYGWGYGWPVARTVADALPGLLAVGSLLAATAWALWRKPAVGFLGAWFFIILAPTSSFVPVADVVFEHRMYLSLAAVVTLTVLGGFRFGEHLVAKGQKLGRIFVWSAGGMAAVALTALTIQRNHDYRSELAIWQDTASKCPNNPRAHYALGDILERMGRVPEAIPHWEMAIRLKPSYAEAHCNLGNVLWQTGKVPEAIEHLELALRYRADFPEAHNNLGNALLKAGRVQEATRHYEQALRLKKNFPEPHNNLGFILLQAGKVQEAIAQFEEALRIKPDYAEAHYSLGNAYFQLGRIQDTIVHYEQAVRLKPNHAEAHCNLGFVLAQVGRSQEAVGQYEQALRIQPDYAEAHYYLGNMLAEAGKVSEAAPHWEQAVRIKPDYADAHNNLAIVLSQAGKTSDAIAHWEQALRSKPDYAEAHNNLAYALWQTGRIPDAIQHYESALRVKADYPQAQINLARLLAIQPPAEGGDPSRALQLAQRACELTGNRDVVFLDTLAVSLAANGRFNEAINTSQKAIELAHTAGLTQVVAQIEKRLESYRVGRPAGQSAALESKSNR